MNGLDKDGTGFGTRSGLVYRNEGKMPGWCWFVGCCKTRGPFATKAEAVADRDKAISA